MISDALVVLFDSRMVILIGLSAALVLCGLVYGVVWVLDQVQRRWRRRSR